MKRQTLQTATLNAALGGKKKAKPRGKPYAKGNKWAVKPGEARNPTGKNSGRPPSKLISEAAKKLMEQTVTDPWYGVVSRRLGISKTELRAVAQSTGERISVSDLIAIGQSMVGAGGHTPAAKEMREVTEGRLPETMNLLGKIDYNAGASAKEQLLDKLGFGDTTSAEQESTEQSGQLQTAETQRASETLSED